MLRARRALLNVSAETMMMAQRGPRPVPTYHPDRRASQRRTPWLADRPFEVADPSGPSGNRAPVSVGLAKQVTREAFATTIVEAPQLAPSLTETMEPLQSLVVCAMGEMYQGAELLARLQPEVRSQAHSARLDTLLVMMANLIRLDPGEIAAGFSRALSDQPGDCQSTSLVRVAARATRASKMAENLASSMISILTSMVANDRQNLDRRENTREERSLMGRLVVCAETIEASMIQVECRAWDMLST